MAAQSKSLLDTVFTYKSFVHAIAGATGSVFAMFTFYPLDTARYRLQVEEPTRRKAIGTFELIRQLVNEEGFATLYRGLIPVLQSLCISNFVYFYTFHSLKALNPSTKNQSALKDLLLGSISGIINVLTTTPFWVVNSRLKMKGLNESIPASSPSTSKATPPPTSSPLPYSNLFEGLSYIWKTEGINGLWAGTLPSLMLVSNPALQFMMYESLKRRLSSWKTPSAAEFFIIGAISKSFATIITYPLQLIQTKLRNARKDANGLKNSNLSSGGVGILEMLVQILKISGATGLFRGLEAKLLQTVMTAALMFAAYEKIAATVMSLLIRNRK